MGIYRKPTILKGIKISIKSRELLDMVDMPELKEMLERYGYVVHSDRETEKGYRAVFYSHKNKNGEYDSRGAYWSNTKDMADHFDVLPETLDDISQVSGRTVFDLWCELAGVDEDEAAHILFKASGIKSKKDA